MGAVDNLEVDKSKIKTISSNNTITIPLQNQTGLDENKYSIYILGFSTTSKKMLQKKQGSPTASFKLVTEENGTLPAYKLGEDISEIVIDVSKPFNDDKKIDGARIYFFIAENSQFPKAPQVTYSNHGANLINVKNPPNPKAPPYTFAEFTVIDLNYGAVIDLQTVDGLTFPINLTLNNSLGAIGQPLSSNAEFDRSSVFSEYKSFITKVDTDDSPFLNLYYSENSGGLLNPGLYLTETDNINNLIHLDSPLNRLFDKELTNLFENNKLSIQGVAAGNIKADTYTVNCCGVKKLPSGLKQKALQFIGKEYGMEFCVYSPLDLCTLAFNFNGADKAISGQLNNNILTFDMPLPHNTNLIEGMYISGAGVNPDSTTINSITRNEDKDITGVVISTGTGKPAPSQYGFSKIPGMFWSSGAMVFACAGVFADSNNYTPDEATVVLNIQNQLVSALNRGVANKGPLSGVDGGYTSKYWGTQKNWYPAGVKQNVFSLFMHTAKVSAGSKNIPLFIQAKDSTTCARDTVMGQAYGFAYDENAGPVPPVPTGQPQVPSKFDPLPPGANELTITLGAWVKSATVQSNQGWQETGVIITADHPVTITYRNGHWTADPSTNGGLQYDAAGCPGVTVSQSGYPLRGVNMGTLIGQIGSHPVFLIGNGPTITPDGQTGELKLCINDDLLAQYGPGLKDNKGSVTVQLS